MRTLSVAAFVACAVISACATPPAAPEATPATGEVHVLGHACDEFGVSELHLLVTGQTSATLQWSNKDICGTPS